MIKQVLIAILLIVTFNNSTVAQFYYKDILSNKEAIAERKMLEAQKKKTVVVKSFESATEESKDFFCEKKISADYLKIETKTRSGLTGKSILTSFFNKKGLLVKSTDGEESNATVSTYSYDHTDNLIQITTTSHSSYDGFVTLATEVHQYSYNDKGMPLRLLVIKNDKDTMEVNFTIDEKGNVGEEEEVALYNKHFFYYYDDKNRLTDIVHYNAIKKKVSPDFIFEYNEEGQLGQMISVGEGVNSSYSIWRYYYTNNLRTEERCFSEDKKLMGYFIYEYK